MSRLPFDLPPSKRRKRRRRRLSDIHTPKKEPRQLALLRAPHVQRCGFCGTTVTVLQDATTCPRCNGIVYRDDE